MAVAVGLSADEARRIGLRAQGLLGKHGSDVRGVLRHLGAVQLDTISVLARSHELIPYARIGAVGRPAVEDAYWGHGTSFEYWSHAACILPIEEWPLFAFRRRAFISRGHRWHRMEDAEQSCAAILKRLAEEGPLTSSDIGGSKNGGPWWDWSESKIAIEWLLDIGEVVCTERRSWKRVYDLASRAVPADLLAQELSDEECITRLVGQAGRALGVATRADLADYHRLKAVQVDQVIAGSGLVPVTVEGWGKPAWADPEALATEPRGRHRTTLLSPFDSLVWDRARTERIFGFTHRLEAYVPKPKRVHGYFAMPLLTGGRLVGRVDPAREGQTLVARQISLSHARNVAPAALALREAASWVGCDQIKVERVLPESLTAPLEAAISSL
jgi:uncharacterized protein YcaQ